MNMRFIPMTVRRTVSLPKAIDDLIARRAEGEGSYSAALARLVEAGARALREGRAPSYIGIAEGPGDLGINAERYLRRALREGAQPKAARRKRVVRRG